MVVAVVGMVVAVGMVGMVGTVVVVEMVVVVGTAAVVGMVVVDNEILCSVTNPYHSSKLLS